MSKNLIVTRHATLIEWLRLRGIEGDVIAQATADDILGRDVYGILPLWLAAEANSVTEVTMPGLTLEARKRVNGGDFSVAEMDEWGAEMRTFIVRKSGKFGHGSNSV
jgi:putative CRISPR-associated protein (TIGR02620 family)